MKSGEAENGKHTADTEFLFEEISNPDSPHFDPQWYINFEVPDDDP